MAKLYFNPSKAKRINIALAYSKSISNRMLILQALSGNLISIQHLSDAEDTFILQRALQSGSNVIDVGMAGTAFRFLTAFFSIGNGEVILTGDERMKERPIAPLVDALVRLGAEIQYLEKKGFPPLKIKGKKFSGGKLEIVANISSQYISALLLIAPKLKNGLQLTLKEDQLSRPYVDMSIEILRKCGINVHVVGNEIQVKEGKFQKKLLEVEVDWSAAAFFYNALCCSPQMGLEIFFTKLRKDSLQGDVKVVELYEHFGIQTEEHRTGILIRKAGKPSAQVEFDFSNCPDLVQAFLVSAAVVKREVKISGVKNLKIKETDRIAAMQSEIQKLGGVLKVLDEDQLHFIPAVKKIEKLQIQTYNDHRMAMAFAPLVYQFKEVQVENPGVVKKSFPRFWDEMQKLGVFIKS